MFYVVTTTNFVIFQGSLPECQKYFEAAQKGNPNPSFLSIISEEQLDSQRKK